MAVHHRPRQPLGRRYRRPALRQRVGNDYHLKSGSPAIDKGIGCLAGHAAAPDDFASAPRPQGSSWDAGGFEFNSTPPTPSPPVISGVANSNLSSSTAATIDWNTDEAADSQVEYGTTTAVRLIHPASTHHVTASHSANLSGLASSTLYHYRVQSRDAAGNLATSGDFTFTTAAARHHRAHHLHVSTSPASPPPGPRELDDQ